MNYNNPIPFVDLTHEGRAAELTNPLIRLFQDSPKALQKILDSLSIFIKERNETNTDSFESNLYNSIESLVNERAVRDQNQNPNPIEINRKLKPYQFTNQMIKDKLVEITEAEAIEDSENKKKGMYYSPEVGLFGQSRTTTILKSKFKFKKIPNIRIGDKTHRW